MLRTCIRQRVLKYSKNLNYCHKLQVRKYSIISEIQNGVISFHQLSGLPWYMTLAFSSFGVRLLLFPLARSRIKTSYNLSLAMPELNSLFQMLTRRLSTISKINIKERFKIFSVYIQGVKASLKLNDVNLTSMFSYTAASFGFFISFIYSLRQLIEEERELNESNTDNNMNNEIQLSRTTVGLKEGGVLWFKDLTEQDNTNILPILSILSSYLAMEFSFASMTGSGRQLTISRSWKSILQAVLILSYPFISVFPAGVFSYWIPGTWLSLLQSRLMKNPTFLKMIFLKPPTLRR